MDKFILLAEIWCYYCGHMKKVILEMLSQQRENMWWHNPIDWYARGRDSGTITEDMLAYTILAYHTIGRNWKPEMNIDLIDLLSKIAENKGMSKDRGPILEILKTCVGNTFAGMIKDESQDYMVYSVDIKLLEIDGEFLDVREREFYRRVHIEEVLLFHPAIFAYLLI